MVDINSPDLVEEYKIEGNPFAFNHSGDLVVIIDIGEIWINNFETGEKIIRLGSGYGNFPDAIAFSPDDRFIALQTGLGNIAIWAVPSQ